MAWSFLRSVHLDDQPLGFSASSVRSRGFGPTSTRPITIREVRSRGRADSRPAPTDARAARPARRPSTRIRACRLTVEICTPHTLSLGHPVSAPRREKAQMRISRARRHRAAFSRGFGRPCDDMASTSTVEELDAGSMHRSGERRTSPFLVIEIHGESSEQATCFGVDP